ncbi:MAG: drug/metabolite transporter (DMT)-like permease [Parasphingorhabdus sp.]
MLLHYCSLFYGSLIGDSVPCPGKTFFMALLNNAIPFVLIGLGQQHIASGLAAILNAATPLFTIIVAHRLTTDEHAGPIKIAGVIFGMAGVCLMIGVEALQSVSLQMAGEIAILGAALSYGFASVFGRRFKKSGVSNIAVASGQVTASSLILLPLMLFIDHPWTLAIPSQSTILSLLGLGILSTALAYIIYFKIRSSAGATNLSLVTLLIPVNASLLGWWFLEEILSPVHFAGMALIGTGLLLIDQRPAGKFMDVLKRLKT